MLLGGGTTCGLNGPVPFLDSDPPASDGGGGTGFARRSPDAVLPQLFRSRLTCEGGGATTTGAGSVSFELDVASRRGAEAAGATTSTDCVSGTRELARSRWASTRRRSWWDVRKTVTCIRSSTAAPTSNSTATVKRWRRSAKAARWSMPSARTATSTSTRARWPADAPCPKSGARCTSSSTRAAARRTYPPFARPPVRESKARTCATARRRA